jgi:protocatechuate 3,4-dioxygenase beta subunit
VQDGGSETGIPSVVVNLLSNSIVIATTTTDVNGAYAFTNLPPGDYAVRFTPPTGFEVTLRDIGGDDTADSDPDRVTGEHHRNHAGVSGENDPTWDAGLYIQRASLGNFVWLDVNGDGIQSGGSETGIPSVVVNLLSNGTVIATTTTDVSGAYAFTNLVPGARMRWSSCRRVALRFTQPDLGGE